MRTISRGRKTRCTLVLLAILALAMLAAGCRAGAAQSATPAANAAGAGTKAAGDALKQTNQGGNVTIAVEWENPAAGGAEPVRFDVAMNTHSVDLDAYDLSKLAVLRNDQGLEVKPLEWNAPKGGHHRSGKLAFAPSEGGKPLLAPGTKSIELVIHDVAGVKERSFRWDVPQ